MLTKVEARNNQGSVLTFELADLSSGFAVRDISGLHPGKASIVMSDYAIQDGSQFHSSRREQRNITMQLGLRPDYGSASVWELRQQLYSFFMPKTEVALRFYMVDGLTVNITGRVESLEGDLFTREPRVDISILCPEPDFIDLEETEVTGNTVADTTEQLVTYDGSVETGFEFVLSLDRNLDEFTIYHRLPNDILKSLTFQGELLTDDVLTISTVTGNKHVTLTRASSDSSVLYAVVPQSTWLELEKGDNYIRVYAVGDPIPFAITYTNRYGGL